MFKQKDIITLGVVVFAAAVLSVIFSSLLFSSKSSNFEAEQVPSISSNFPKPDDTIFQNLTIDPTVLIHINNNNNNSLFNGGQ